MPVISFVSPKGGAGKSTSAVVLATELAESGATVAIIDADPNKPVSQWADQPGKPENLVVIADVTQDTIVEEIDNAAAQVAFTIVDLEGTASLTVAWAISRADLVIIPTQGSQLDSQEAGKAVRLIRAQEKVGGREIPFALLYTRTNPAIRPRTLRFIQDAFRKHGLFAFETQMHEREAFRALFSFGGTLSSLNRANVPNLDAAILNSRSFANEVVTLLREIERARAAA